MHEERLAEHPVAEEVEVLLADHDIRRQRGDQLADALGNVPELAVGQVGLGEELQATSRGVLHELVEVERRADGGEVVVVEQRVGAVEHPLQLLTQHAGVRSGGLDRDDRPHQVLGAGEPLGRRADALEVVGQDVPRHVAQVGAGVGVVAHERDPLRRQQPAGQIQQRPAGGRRDPRIHAVGDHVIDRIDGRERLGLAEVPGPQLHVFKSRRRGQRPSPLDRRGRRVDSHDRGRGQGLGDRRESWPRPRSRARAPGSPPPGPGSDQTDDRVPRAARGGCAGRQTPGRRPPRRRPRHSQARSGRRGLRQVPPVVADLVPPGRDLVLTRAQGARD